jgi:hypothetical protein
VAALHGLALQFDRAPAGGLRVTLRRATLADRPGS